MEPTYFTIQIEKMNPRSEVTTLYLLCPTLLRDTGNGKVLHWETWAPVTMGLNFLILNFRLSVVADLTFTFIVYQQI